LKGIINPQGLDSVSVLMGLNLSNQQIAAELDLNKDDVQQMTTQLRQGVVAKKNR
jgi:hypothetical protein